MRCLPNAAFPAAIPIASLTLVLFAPTAASQGLPSEYALAQRYDARSMQVGAGVDDLVAADLDGDGDLDAVSADAVANQLQLLINNGSGAFAQRTIAIGNAPATLATVDLDGDGDLDLVIGCSTELRTLVNDGAANFRAGVTVSLPSGDADPVSVIPCDLNGDGLLDLLAGVYVHSLPSGSYTGGVVVALGNGFGGFTVRATQPLPLPTHRIVAADFNGDGWLDVASLGGFITASRLDVVFGASNGTFVGSGTQYTVGQYCSGLVQGDLDGNGSIDLAAGGKYSVRVFLNQGAGTFAAGQLLTPGTYAKGLALGDIDHDGDLDLLATSGSAMAMRLYSNGGHGLFALTASVPTTLQTLSVLLADANGDGYDDLWSGDYSSGVVTIAMSRTMVAGYGQGTINSRGSRPELTASGLPTVGSSDFALQASGLIVDQPAFVVASPMPGAIAAFGGTLLVAPPGLILSVLTSHGGGNPLVADGTLTVPVTAAQLAAVGLGTRFYVQVLANDPGRSSGATFSNGVWFEVSPP